MLTVATLIALAPFVAPCIGCGWAPAIRARPLESYEVVIDPKFTPADNVAIADALIEWQARVPVQFTVSERAHCGLQEGVICLFASTRANVDALIGPFSDRGVGYTWPIGHLSNGIGGALFIATDYGFRKQVVEHELGHAMGLSHIQDPAAIMYTVIGADTATSLGDADVAEWWSLRY